ncbi:MAG TPA: HAMP domain-containing sensor histidine kinase, partial [Vicinamibacteria bacterium]
VGAVLLPSVALSVLSFHAVPKYAENLKIGLYKDAEKMLGYVEKDLEMTARKRALQAARAVGTERLLEGRPQVIRAALDGAGLQDTRFDTLRLEAWSPATGLKAALAGPKPDDVKMLREALRVLETAPASADGEDSVPLTTPDGKELGVLRFRFACEYVHGNLVRDYFENEFVNPDREWVIRVTEPTGEVLYETRPTPNDTFEVKRIMTVPSFRGLKLQLRARERSFKDEVRRLAMAKTALIGFIDLMLLAGLYLAYSNVRREIHLSRLKSDFVANVSHELKTPLALIRLFAETLELGRVPGEEKAMQYYRIINKESQRLTQLINNILDFSRIEAGRKQYRFVPTDLSRIVREVVEAYRFPIEQQGFTLEVEVAEDLPEVEIDPEAIEQALLNLVNNAIKYSSDQKYVRLVVRRDGERILIAVRDKGIGVAKADQKRIFEKFYRAENTLVHTTKGSGLGLALVQHIMEAHGGSVELESAPGVGSTFTLVLPLTKKT